MGVASFLYNAVLKRSGTMVVVAVIGSVFLERTIDWAATEMYYKRNQGKVYQDMIERVQASKQNN